MIQFALTPEIILGDVNGDLIVNFLDIAPFIQALATADFVEAADVNQDSDCLLYTSPSPRDQRGSRMPSSA